MYGGTWPPNRTATPARTDDEIPLDGADDLIDAALTRYRLFHIARRIIAEPGDREQLPVLAHFDFSGALRFAQSMR